MSVYKRPGQSVYSYDFRYRGQRFSGSTGCATQREAKQFEARERKRVEGLRIDATKPLTFEAAAARYWNEVGQFHRNHADTLRALDWLLTYIGKGTMIATLTDNHVAALVARRRGQGVGAASVNRGVCEPLRAILKRSGEIWGQTVQRIRWKDHFLREPQERIREASQDEEAALMAAIRGDYAPALRFALLSGCRRAEIVGLKWTAVDFFNREITILGKGDKTRVIPMTVAMYDLLREEHGNDPLAVFTYNPKRGGGTHRRPITMEGFKTEWRRTLKRAGVENFRFHDTRHTAATRLVRATGNLKHAQQLLGHSDLATTSRYAHVTKDDLRAGMEAATPTQNATGASVEGDYASKIKGKVV